MEQSTLQILIMSFISKKYLGNKFRSKRSEKRAARIFGGRVQPASGALPVAHLKADVKSRTFLVDDKTTESKSFSINIEVWRKLTKEAFVNRRKPCMRIEFSQSQPLYLIDEMTFVDMLEAYEALLKSESK
jgi:hypothetical protein